MSSLQLLVEMRRHLRSSATRIYNARLSYPNYSEAEKHNLKLKISSLQQNLIDKDNEIINLKWQDESSRDSLEQDLQACEDYQDHLRESLSLLVVSQNVHSGAGESARSVLRSPIAPLPSFSSSKGENLELFFRQFEDTIAKFNYTEYDKLLLLKQQISGKALYLIDSLEADRQVYSEAKKLLNDALASPAVQKFNTIRQLSEMKLTYDDEPFEYIGKMRKIQQAVEALSITSEDIMQHFFFNGLNENFKKQLVLINNDTSPSLNKISETFFQANERYQAERELELKLKTKNDSEQNTVACAVKVNIPTKNKSNPFVNCTLCRCENELSHPIHKCLKYKSSSEKLNRLIEVSGCCKCANLGHSADKCSFKFRNKCSMCGAWHFSFLCDKNVKFMENCPKHQNNSKGGNKSNASYTGLAYSGTSLKTNDNDAVILPTFRCKIGNLNFRGLRDSGSQSNFVNEEILSKIEHTVLRSLNLKVHGINEACDYESKLVELSLRLGNETRVIRALSLPEIKIELKLPGLRNIAQSFKNKGYVLADPALLNEDKISRIDLILGSGSANCFRDRSILFGSNSSVFSVTPFGVLLMGSIEQLSSDINFLPECKLIADEERITGLSDLPSCDQTSTNVTFFHAATHHTFVQPNEPYSVLDSKNKVRVDELDRALSDSLNDECSLCLDESTNDNNETSEVDDKLIIYMVDNIVRKEDGRLEVPLLWNGRVNHLLGNNYNLAKCVLQSNLKKYSKEKGKIEMIDANFKELQHLGVIKKIENFDSFAKQFPNYSFLAHMPVFRMDHESTKCRNVFLSNLCGKTHDQPNAISHNQAMWAGPCLNQRLSTSLLFLRFDEKVLTFDLKKAFLQLELSESDQSKLLFLWFKNVKENEFSIEIYKNVRLSFGLRPSPTLLMMALFKILILDAEFDSKPLKDLKKLIYALIYVDNGAVTGNSSKELMYAFDKLPAIFGPYKFDLQQFQTNDRELGKKLDSQDSTVVKLLGLDWDKVSDTLAIRKLFLDPVADTKRKVLKTLASNFDPYQFCAPLLNRAKLFLHDLQLDKIFDWDRPFNNEKIKQWKNICSQVNSAPQIKIPRFVGRRSDTYRLLAFVDSSKQIYGCVVYLQNETSGEVSLLMSKSKIVATSLESKTIPALELLSIVLGTETIIDLWRELTGPLNVLPIKISELTVFSDSLVALSWVNSYTNKLEKMSKANVFVKNRLEQILNLCHKIPVNYTFVSGFANPADCVTRPLSHRQLLKTEYLNGPKFLHNPEEALSKADVLKFVVPNPVQIKPQSVALNVLSNCSNDMSSEQIIHDHIVAPERFSSFVKFVRVHQLVLQFICMVGRARNLRLPDKSPIYISNDRADAFKLALGNEQRLWYPEVLKYFDSNNLTVKDMPNIVAQLNLFMDNDGLIRVGAKFPNYHRSSYFPLLLHKRSKVTESIIYDFHRKFQHCGVYSLLAEIRTKFWIPHRFSTVKRVLKKCIHCKRYNERTLKLNQSDYRDFRLCPENIPYANIFVDFMGPFQVNMSGNKVKVWILCITCLWSRSINLKVTTDLSVKEYLRALQLHIFEFGMPTLVLSDSGSQLVAGASIISDFFNDAETKDYFEQNGVKTVEFQQYYKGHNELGSLVESCVKITKRLLSSAVGKNVLEFRDFEFSVAQCVHLSNRRPIAFKEALRENSCDDVPDPITPELLIRGYNLMSVNVIPDLQSIPDDPDWVPYCMNAGNINKKYVKLASIRDKMKEIYNSEYLALLMDHATNKKERYRVVNHKGLEVGDIVLLKEQFSKPSNYPMGIVREVQINSLGEVTGATIFKSNSRELVKRHSSTIIPLLSQSEPVQTKIFSDSQDDVVPRRPPRRKAAIVSDAKTKLIVNS